MFWFKYENLLMEYLIYESNKEYNRIRIWSNGHNYNMLIVSAVTTILCGLKISCSEIMVQTINNLVNAQKINLGSV